MPTLDRAADFAAAVLRHYAREDTATLLPRIHMRYVLDAMEWTIEQSEQMKRADVEQRFAEIVTEMDIARDE